MKGFMLCLLVSAAGAIVALPASSKDAKSPATQRDPGLFVATTQGGTLDPKTGNLIAYWLVRVPGVTEGATVFEKKPLVFGGDYAILIIWPSKDCKFIEHFYIYDNKAKRISVTQDFEVFLRRINRLPKGVTVYQLEKCTVSFDYWMPREKWHRLNAAMKAGGRKWADDEDHRFDPCTCTVELLFPDSFKY